MIEGITAFTPTTHAQAVPHNGKNIILYNRMKKLLLCGALAAGCCLASTAQDKINNAGRLQLMKFTEQRAELAKKSPAKAAAYTPNVSVIVTLSKGATASDLSNAGFEVLHAADDMAIVTLPISATESLAALQAVDHIDFGHTASPLMDEARAASGVDACHEGSESGLDKAYKGQGVYVGLYDTGLDPNHINFTDHQGKTRVKAVYEAQAGVVTKHETDNAIATYTTDTRTESHGTHVLGIMTGREDVQGSFGKKQGVSTSTVQGAIPYYGVAPEADILVGCGSFDNVSINAGVAAVVERAKADGKPVVVNLSLGHNRGSHDPNEAVNKYLDILSKDAVICVAAGNEGGSEMSIERTCRGTGPNSKLNTFVVPTRGATAATMYTAEFWSDSDTPFTCELVLYNTASKQIVASLPLTGESGSKNWKASDNSVFAQAYTSSSSVRASWGIDRSTNRYNVSLDNTMQSTGSVPVLFGVNITGNNGQKIFAYCDAYDGYSESEVKFSQEGVSGYLTGTDKGSINGMACGYNTISVGAWVSRTQMPTLGNTTTTYDAGGLGKIAGFSSYGTSGDGRSLPIVCAPGAQIISSVSRYWVENKSMAQSTLNAYAQANGRDNHWYYMQGTSMACPFASGTIALWLEACPGLRANEVKQIIEKTSTKDANTVPTNRWGAGKINALAGLKEAIVMSASVESTLVDNADQNLMVVAKGGKQFEVSCPGVNNLSCSLYNLQGAAVASADDSGDTIDLDASSLQEGIYVLSVNAGGQKLSRKLVVK